MNLGVSVFQFAVPSIVNYLPSSCKENDYIVAEIPGGVRVKASVDMASPSLEIKNTAIIFVKKGTFVHDHYSPSKMMIGLLNHNEINNSNDNSEDQPDDNSEDQPDNNTEEQSEERSNDNEASFLLTKGSMIINTDGFPVRLGETVPIYMDNGSITLLPGTEVTLWDYIEMKIINKTNVRIC